MPNTFTMTPATGGGSIDLIEAALSPKKTRTEEGVVEERSIQELILARDADVLPPDAVPWGIRLARAKYGSTTG